MEREERDRETVRRCFVRWILIVAVCGQGQWWLGPQLAAKEVGQGARVELHSVRREQLPRQSPSQRLQRTRWEALAKKKKTAADSGKRSSGKGMGALLDQEAIRGTQHAKIKADTQETLQALEKTIEAMGDNENTTGVHNTHGKGMQRHSKEAQQTTDPWHFKSSPKTKDRQEDK